MWDKVINAAIINSEREKQIFYNSKKIEDESLDSGENTIENESIKGSDEDFNYKTPRILIIGCGHTGCCTINRLHNMGVEGAETIAIDSDRQDLDSIHSDKRILIGIHLVRGFGAGGYPDVGQKITEMARPTLQVLLESTDICFITTGLGGGTGTGSVPVIAQIAKEAGAIVIGIFYNLQNDAEIYYCETNEFVKRLSKICHSVIWIEYPKILKAAENYPIEQILSIKDQLIGETIKGITERFTTPSFLNFNYSDIISILTKGGASILLLGECDLIPTLDDYNVMCKFYSFSNLDFQRAKGAIFLISCGSDITTLDYEKITSSIVDKFDGYLDYVCGIRIRSDISNQILVQAILTGIPDGND